MALFKRADLEAQGLSKEQIEFIMTESGRALSSNYTLKSDVQAQVDAAVNAAKGEPVNVKETPEYRELANERDMLRAIGSDDFATVKPKFREQVFGMIDRGANAKPLAEQLSAIKEKFEEYYIPDQPKEEPKKPQFGSPDKGNMPKGNEAASDAITNAWGFVPPKK